MKKAWRYRKGTLLHYKGTTDWAESYFTKGGWNTWVRSYEKGTDYPKLYSDSAVQAHIDRNNLTIVWEG